MTAVSLVYISIDVNSAVHVIRFIIMYVYSMLNDNPSILYNQIYNRLVKHISSIEYKQLVRLML